MFVVRWRSGVEELVFCALAAPENERSKAQTAIVLIISFILAVGSLRDLTPEIILDRRGYQYSEARRLEKSVIIERDETLCLGWVLFVLFRVVSWIASSQDAGPMIHEITRNNTNSTAQIYRSQR